MQNQAQVTEVEQLAAQALAAMGSAETGPLMRTFLIRDGYFVGYRFRAQGAYAVWTTGADHVDLFTDDGQPLQSVPLANPNRIKAA